MYSTSALMLLAMHTPKDGYLSITAEPTSSYEGISAILTSLKKAGYRLKIGYVTSAGS